MAAFPSRTATSWSLLRPEHARDGALSLVSKGQRFGEPGMYLTVAGRAGEVRARRTPITEVFTVYESANGELRTDHFLNIYGYRLARLHYRMERE
jgi:hypothetical protein